MEQRAYISQQDYQKAYAAENEKYGGMMKDGRFALLKQILYEKGPVAAAQMVKDQLKKSTTTQGWSTTTGAVFFDLRAPLYLLAPVFAHIRSTTPRWGKVNAGYGIQPNWKAITGFDQGTNPTFPGVSEGNRNAYASVAEQNFSAPYATLGTDDYVTYEAEAASEGFDDNLGTAHEVQMLRFLNLEEKTLLGGAGTNTGAVGGAGLQLGVTNTPVTSVASGVPTGGTYGLTTGTFYGGFCVALAYRASDAYRANVITSTNTSLVTTVPASGIQVQFTRNNADGSSDVINSSTAQLSAASNATAATANNGILFQVAPMAGAFAYAWFVQSNATTFTPSATTAVLTAITAASAWVYYSPTQQPGGTQHPNVFSADWSTNQLDFDGLLTIASNTAYTSSWAPQNSYVQDLHGAGLTNGAMVGSVAELDTALFQIQSTTLTSPTAIYLSTDVVNTFRKAYMANSTNATTITFFAPVGKSKALSLPNAVADYYNVFSIDDPFIPVIQHPYLPAGTILIDTTNLGAAYEHSRVGETRGVFVRRDTYGQEFARTSRKYPFGVYSEEVLGVKTPHLLGIIKSIGAFGQAKLF